MIPLLDSHTGYRYVRQYRRKNGAHPWALYEVRHGRAQRIGTAETEETYREFLGLRPRASGGQ